MDKYASNDSESNWASFGKFVYGVGLLVIGVSLFVGSMWLIADYIRLQQRVQQIEEKIEHVRIP